VKGPSMICMEKLTPCPYVALAFCAYDSIDPREPWPKEISQARTERQVSTQWVAHHLVPTSTSERELSKASKASDSFSS